MTIFSSKEAGRRLGFSIKLRGKTQAEFAESFYVDERTLRRWIAGELHSVDTWVELANALDVDLLTLLGLSDGDGPEGPLLFRTQCVLFSFFVLCYNVVTYYHEVSV